MVRWKEIKSLFSFFSSGSERREENLYLYCYNTERAHFGRGMDGMSPFEKLKLLRPKIKKDITLFPPYLLDKLVPIYLYLPFAQKLNYPSQIPCSGGNDVLVHYSNIEKKFKNIKVLVFGKAK